MTGPPNERAPARCRRRNQGSERNCGHRQAQTYRNQESGASQSMLSDWGPPGPILARHYFRAPSVDSAQVVSHG